MTSPRLRDATRRRRVRPRTGPALSKQGVFRSYGKGGPLTTSEWTVPPGRRLGPAGAGSRVDLPGGGLARRRWRRRGRLAGPRPPGTSPWRPLRDEPVRSQARGVSSEVAATGAPCRRRWTATCRLRRSRGVPLRPSLRARASCGECSRRPLPGCESAAA